MCEQQQLMKKILIMVYFMMWMQEFLKAR